MKTFKSYLAEFTDIFTLLDLSDEEAEFKDEWEGDEDYETPEKDEKKDKEKDKTKFNPEELTKYLQRVTAAN